MLAVDRQNQILAYLGAKGSVKTKELSRLLEASEETIRQDLIHLENQGELRRVHGGAAPSGTGRLTLPLPEREALHREAKVAIAREACALINPRDTVFLDASSTVLTMTSFFPNQETTVITNANHVIIGLSPRRNIDLICTGGDYERRSRSYTGRHAFAGMQRYLIQKMFLGVDGIDSNRGASELNDGQARLKEQIIDLAQEVYILADASKLEQQSSFFFARLSKINTLITTRPDNPSILNNFRKAGVSVIVADD
ncbi:MAG: DeoR/GlpR family DNA-binding transcription regulator [Verrucomicrobiota bacterium JB025]|nr:DeoR/GlpR family DNA-binding transcription regulator [Verrucomicrobiota bacterium JB025]